MLDKLLQCGLFYLTPRNQYLCGLRLQLSLLFKKIIPLGHDTSQKSIFLQYIRAT